jgi:hypothetical protein
VVAIRLGGGNVSGRRRGFRIQHSEDSGSAERAVQGRTNRSDRGAPTARIAELERRLRLNSLNSSKPPSRDRSKKPARTFQRTAGQAKESQGRTPTRQVADHCPSACSGCGAASGNECEPLSADHALPASSVGLQDRAAWPASVFEDQRGHAGDVCGDPRTLHACHAGKEALFLGHRNLLTLSFSRSVTPETSRRRRSRA